MGDLLGSPHVASLFCVNFPCGSPRDPFLFFPSPAPLSFPTRRSRTPRIGERGFPREERGKAQKTQGPRVRTVRSKDLKIRRSE